MSHLPTLNQELGVSLEKYTKQLKSYIIKALEGYPSSLRDRKIQSNIYCYICQDNNNVPRTDNK